jgi:hypothetical protein
MLGLIRYVTFSFPTVDSLMILYIALVRSKLEYTSVAWFSITVTDSSNLNEFKEYFQLYVITDFLLARAITDMMEY